MAADQAIMPQIFYSTVFLNIDDICVSIVSQKIIFRKENDPVYAF